MASARVPSLCFGCCLLLLLGACEESAQIRGGGASALQESQEEEAMLGALQDVLEKLRDRCLPAIEKKLSWVPSCDAGEHCAVRKGSRIGRLCNCPRGMSCNLYILKCL
ncbi:cocaine- and amphetamine-regulated transcript protein [Pogona vitticeps]